MVVSYRVFQAIRVAGSPGARARRMAAFAMRSGIRPGQRVLDLGGTPEIWEGLSTPLRVTLLNLPGAMQRAPHNSHHEYAYVEGDACAAGRFGDGEFDLVFSNSVIEHVGGLERQAAFAHEVLRLGRSYWVQTPSVWFPLEAHCGAPFWWLYPEPLRQSILRRWRRKLPAWSEMVAGVRAITRRRMESLFPGCSIYTERVLGVPKSISAYRTLN